MIEIYTDLYKQKPIDFSRPTPDLYQISAPLSIRE